MQHPLCSVAFHAGPVAIQTRIHKHNTVLHDIKYKNYEHTYVTILHYIFINSSRNAFPKGSFDSIFLIVSGNLLFMAH